MFLKDQLLSIDESKRSPHHIIQTLIKKNSIILDVGCNTGYLGKALKQKGVVGDGIDINEEALKIAKKYYRHTYKRNLYKPGLDIGKKLYDYIVLADVLEHLPQPDLLLKNCQKYLKDEGKIIISLPNIARLEVRLKLLLGKFDYAPGIISQDHLRFFTNKTAVKMIEESGFIIEKTIPTGLGQMLKFFPTLTAFQFIYILRKNNIHGLINDNWDIEWKKYIQNPYFKPNKKVLKIIKECFHNKLTGKKILEVGAGSGCDIISLVQAGARGYALDFSEESIKTIKYWLHKKNIFVNTVKADIKKIPYPDSYFDLVYSVGLLEHFPNPLSLIKEQVRVIKKGGFLIIDVPQKFTLYSIIKHIRMLFNRHPFGWETEYSKSDLLKLADKLGYQPFLIYGRDFDIIPKLPKSLRPLVSRILKDKVEDSFLAPYLCLNIGLVLKTK